MNIRFYYQSLYEHVHCIYFYDDLNCKDIIVSETVFTSEGKFYYQNTI